MNLRVVTVGASRCAWANDAVAHYAKRIRSLGPIGVDVVRAEPFRGDKDKVRAEESKRLLKTIKPRDRLVLLDERGVCMDTPSFAKWVDKERQHANLVFAIGGAFGHDEEARKRAGKLLRLSDFILNHEVARVVLYEQLYRAETLLTGHPYSH